MAEAEVAITARTAALKQTLPSVDEQIKQALVPNGKLRAGINLSNFLLVTGQVGDATPVGVSPGLAGALAAVLECPIEYIVFSSPGALADAAPDDVWDIGNIGAEPARAEFISFTSAYAEIEATCLVPSGSKIESFAHVDQPGVQIASKKRAAYTLWLERNLEHASLRLYDSPDEAAEALVSERFDVLAGLRPRLLEDEQRIAGSRLLPDKFAAVQQAIGISKSRHPCGAVFLEAFVAAAKRTGLVQALIDIHQVNGKLAVAD